MDATTCYTTTESSSARGKKKLGWHVFIVLIADIRSGASVWTGRLRCTHCSYRPRSGNQSVRFCWCVGGRDWPIGVDKVGSWPFKGIRTQIHKGPCPVTTLKALAALSKDTRRERFVGQLQSMVTTAATRPLLAPVLLLFLLFRCRTSIITRPPPEGPRSKSVPTRAIRCGIAIFGRTPVVPF